MLSRLVCCKTPDRAGNDADEWIEPIPQRKKSSRRRKEGKGSKRSNGARADAAATKMTDDYLAAVLEGMDWSIDEEPGKDRDDGADDDEEDRYVSFNSSDSNAPDHRAVRHETFQERLSTLGERMGTMILRSMFSEDVVLRTASEIRRRGDDGDSDDVGEVIGPDDSIKLERRSTASIISNITEDPHFREDAYFVTKEGPKFIKEEDARIIEKEGSVDVSEDGYKECNDDGEAEPRGGGTAMNSEYAYAKEKPKLVSQFSDAAWC